CADGRARNWGMAPPQSSTTVRCSSTTTSTKTRCSGWRGCRAGRRRRVVFADQEPAEGMRPVGRYRVDRLNSQADSFAVGVTATFSLPRTGQEFAFRIATAEPSTWGMTAGCLTARGSLSGQSLVVLSLTKQKTTCLLPTPQGFQN